MDTPIVSLRDATRRFGDRTALDCASFELLPGRILALVGPNGSGKTTLLKLLAGFLRPSAGEVRVFGLDPVVSRAEIMADARFAFAPPSLYANLTARETLHALTAIGSSSGASFDSSAVDRALDRVGLLDRADDRVRVFSFGMRQRLAIAQALLPMPKLLVLDEPTDGLDPLAVLELRAILTRLRAESGVTILLSSHLLIEVEHLVDDMLLLHEGRSLFFGSPKELLDGRRCLRLSVEGDGDARDRAVDAMRAKGWLAEATSGRDITLPCGTVTLPDAARLLAEQGLELSAFHEESPTLESALLDRIREARRGDGAAKTSSDSARSGE